MHYSAAESQDAALREESLLAALPAFVAHTKKHSPPYRKRFKYVDAGAITSRESLAKLPITAKADLIGEQEHNPPFGNYDCFGKPLRFYLSPGPIAECDFADGDYWRTAAAFYALGLRASPECWCIMRADGDCDTCIVEIFSLRRFSRAYAAIASADFWRLSPPCKHRRRFAPPSIASICTCAISVMSSRPLLSVRTCSCAFVKSKRAANRSTCIGCTKTPRTFTAVSHLPSQPARRIFVRPHSPTPSTTADKSPVANG